MTEPTGKLADKIALVTGGSSGIGLAAAKLFVAEGAYTFIAARRETELKAAVEQIGDHAAGVPCDISNLSDLDRLFAFIQKQKGRLDVLFANAGTGTLAPLESVTEGQFDKAFETNVKGTLFTVQKGLPLMKKGGSIILTGSTASVKGTPHFGVYAATKAAIRSFARTWAMDLRHRGLRVNVVSPGTIPTPGYKSELGLTDEQIDQVRTQAAASTPLGRTGRPEEVAKAALFLASDDSSYINGIELFVDGGATQV